MHEAIQQVHLQAPTTQSRECLQDALLQRKSVLGKLNTPLPTTHSKGNSGTSEWAVSSMLQIIYLNEELHHSLAQRQVHAEHVGAFL